MSSADDFRQYANECIEYARVSTAPDIRKHFLDMAKMWTLAAAQLEEGRYKVRPLGAPMEPPTHH